MCLPTALVRGTFQVPNVPTGFTAPSPVEHKILAVPRPVLEVLISRCGGYHLRLAGAVRPPNDDVGSPRSPRSECHLTSIGRPERVIVHLPPGVQHGPNPAPNLEYHDPQVASCE